MIKFFENEPYAPISYLYEVGKVLHSSKSKYQSIKVIENPFFGKILILDDIVQLTEKDEFFYHEMLTHVVMHAHKNPKRVVVIGGGDGGTVTEVLKHHSVEKVFFVEIDEEVINVSKEFFPQISSGVNDPRVEIHTMDGADFIKKAKNIDVVIVDSTDIIGFARTLYTIDFFESVKKCLSEDGIFVSHTESLHFHKDIVVEIQTKLKQVFPIVDLYTAPIATYPGNWWTFSVGSLKFNPRKIDHHFNIYTKYYDPEIHQQSFVTNSFYQKLMGGQLKW
jgi:spermidine synthase